MSIFNKYIFVDTIPPPAIGAGASLGAVLVQKGECECSWSGFAAEIMPSMSTSIITLLWQL